MVVRPGYKHSEVGVIPEEWRAMRVDALFVITAGGDFEQSRSSDTQSDWYPYPIYANGLSQQGLHGFCNYAEARAGSITVTGRGTLGKAFYRNEPFVAIGRLLVLEPKVNLDARFFSEYINHGIHFSVESTGVPQLTAPHVARYSVPVPPVPEQRSIADALSDADALIESLEQLLAKKRQIKKGAMQELLTGKKRLPGFSGEWRTVRAGALGRFQGGCGFPTQFQGATSGDYPFFKVSDMNNEGNETFMTIGNNYISEQVRELLGAKAFPVNSIVFAKVGAAVFLERKRILVEPSCIDNNMTAFVLDDDGATDYRFLHYAFVNTNLRDLVSTTALPSLSGSVLSAIEFLVPPIAEQTAIAAVLSDMDAEIAALEARLSKARQIKQGMMQELLTGRTRLV